jgi:hypothetical protein
MEKKEFLKTSKEYLNEPALSKEPILPSKARLGDRIFNIIKFLLGICLLPFVYSSTVAFLAEMGALDAAFADYFWRGVISFVVIYLFVYEPVVIYNKGQKILEAVFRFFAPLVKVAPYVLPIYTIILLLIYSAYAAISGSSDALKYFVFLFGFSISLHLIFGAKSLRSRQGDFLKGNYIFGFGLVYIINIFILVLGFSVLFGKFSAINFCNGSLQAAKGIFDAVFTQLFVCR